MRRNRHDLSLAKAGRQRLARIIRDRMSTRLITVLAVALVIVSACAVGLGVTFAGSDTPTMRAGVAVPAEQKQVIDSAAHSCPSLTFARLAGQLMAESAFDTAVTTTSSGGRGIAGLTDVVWSRWRPNADAPRSDAKANIEALAHDMCDLVGQLRAAKVPGDGWRDALAAYHSGISAVTRAGGVPPAATGYVNLVAGYAAWYAQPSPRPATPSATPSQSPGSSAGGWGPAKPIPATYLPLVLAAGKTCPAITAARVAAQLMAASAFQPNLVGAAGGQGIAQFLPEIWSQYAPSSATSPWDPSAAVPALSNAMCDLVGQLSSLGTDPYPLALAAFQWGPLPVRAAGGVSAAPTLQDFIHAVQKYAQAYATDPNLSAGKLASPAPPPTTAAKSTTGQSGTTQSTRGGSGTGGSGTAQSGSTRSGTTRPPANTTGGQNATKKPVPPPAPVWTALTVKATTVLERGQSVHSNRTQLVMESNGDLDIFDENHQRRWTSGTSAKGGSKAVFQADGNLVVYNQNSQSVWTSNTAGRDGAVLVLEADGNVCVVYQGIVVWAANTAH
ncbi:hypothetical protein GCM10023322_54940 [Rugosimonospora acidiphila]|uniref:Bulb-type lectin domain-containing protein n=2 Tax=Rugosimonospora acidiphila TaxID=556531 RepID=A0ABP9SBN7_9ACTN